MLAPWRCMSHIVFVICAFAWSTGYAAAQSRPGCPPSTASLRSNSEVAERGTAGGTYGSAASQIPIWKTITLGGYRSANAVRDAMDKAPCPISAGEWADEILGRPAFPFNKTKVELDLVVISVSQLGFGEDGASLQDIYARALALGLALCPAEVGPVLRLSYLDQPIGEFLHIAMTPVARYSGELVGFTIANGGAGLLFVGGDGRAQVVMPGVVRFVFVRPRPDTVISSTAAHDATVEEMAKR